MRTLASCRRSLAAEDCSYEYDEQGKMLRGVVHDPRRAAWVA
jgi:hypothetical protein